MNGNEVWNILKWMLAALAAGFVGHFGRVLAERLIARRRKAAETGDPRQDASPDPCVASEAIRAEQKIEKKRLKARVKAEKKGGDESR